MLQVPVLVIGFNRPALVDNLLKHLKKIGVSRVYVSLDGPLSSLNRTDCDKTYEVVKSHRDNFDLTVLTRKYNLGCCLGVIAAIDWFFSVVDFGAIIEDDCFVDPDFFQIIADYASSNNQEPRENLRIFTAHNPFNFRFSECVSHTPLIHGWATGSNSWVKIRKNFFKLKLPSRTNNQKVRRTLAAALYWWANSTRARLGIIDTWDGMFADNSWRAGVKTVIPCKNLVDNLGFGPAATHTKDPSQSHKLDLPLSILESHTVDYLIDKFYFKIQKKHILTSLIRVFLDLAKFPSQPNFESMLQRDLSERVIEKF